MQLHEFTRILGTLFYGESEGIVSLWKDLDDSSRDEFLKVCSKDGTVSFVYRKLYEAGLRDGLEKLEAQNARHNAFAIGNQMKFDSLCKLLDGHGIRYAPIKGIDLAFRVYPSPTLRAYCDWDVLFHYEDIYKAVQLLADNGWGTAVPVNADHLPYHFHFPIMRKDGIALEPHWMLPGFDGNTPEQIWRFIHPVGDGAFRHVLEPALNMLLLTRHASRGYYTVIPLSRMLLDAAYIMRLDGFDWKRCREVSDELNLPCSADFLAAFCGFFPDSIREEMSADDERSEAYRKLFEQRTEMHSKPKRDNLTLNNGMFFSLPWLKYLARRLFSSVGVRKRHNLPKQGQYFKVLAYMFWDILCNVWRCTCLLIRRDTAVNDYAELIRVAEGRGETAGKKGRPD